MLKAGLLAGEDELRRFRNEAEAVALLDHRGVVPVYEVGKHAGQHFFSMKLVDGGSLVPLMDRYRHDPRAVAGLVAGASEAVAHAHARGILHRDLKPANILVDAQGHPHITDFGLAKRVEADVELTQSGAVLGTPAYMSPEQASGRRGAVTTASDVYGLGAVLYALLTGRAPFGGSSVVETLEAVRNTPPVPPGRHNAGVPRDLETICLKCLEKDPRRRYPTAQGLADDLRAWLENRPIVARRVGPAERAWLWCRRRPAIAALSAAVALALIGGTATVIAVQARANDGLRAANRRVEQRYELAVDAIKSLHTGVSEDFLLEAGPVQGGARPAAEVGRQLLRQVRRPARPGVGRRLAACAGGVELRAGRSDRQGGPEGAGDGDAPVGPGGAGGAGGRARRRRRGQGRCRAEPDGDRPPARGDGEARRGAGGLPAVGGAAGWPGGFRPLGAGRAGGLPDAYRPPALRHWPDRRGARGLRAGAGRPGGTGGRPRGFQRRPPRPGGHGHPHCQPARGHRQAGGGGGRDTERRPRSFATWPTTTRPSPNSAANWRTAATTWVCCYRARVGRRRRRPSTERRWRSGVKSPKTTQESVNSAWTWRIAAICSPPG